MYVLTSRIARCIGALSLLLILVVGLIPTTFADSGSTLTGSPFNGSDGKLDSNAILTANDLASGQSDNSFGQGTKEDNISVNVVTGSIPPNKNDLTSLYVTGAIGTNNHLFVYLAWTRAVNIGSANLDIELNQNSFSLPTTAQKNVSLNRAAGDLLVLYDFGGSGTPVLSIFSWATSLAAGQSCAVSQDSTPCWVSRGSVNSSDSEAQVSSDGLLGEAVIDLTSAGLVPSGSCETFAQAWDKARSSTSLTAEMKDFISPGSANFNTCGAIAISKISTKGNTALSGAKFNIYSDAAGTTQVGSTLTTDANGKACVSGLAQGTYYVKEISAPTGYAIDNPDLTSVSVNQIGNCTSGAATISFTDTPLSQVEVKFTSLAGSNVTKASIVCANGTTAVAAVSENGSADPTLDDTDETFTNLAPATYTCTVVVDP